MNAININTVQDFNNFIIDPNSYVKIYDSDPLGNSKFGSGINMKVNKLSVSFNGSLYKNDTGSRILIKDHVLNKIQYLPKNILFWQILDLPFCFFPLFHQQPKYD